MDYYSRLGPIDPQVFNARAGRMVPALGYLEKYRQLMEKADNGNINVAEIQLLLEFDQAELYQYDQQRKLSIKLLRDWLCKCKFKNWHKTKTRGEPVTAKMKSDRARDIAETLTNTEKRHSHGYGISMEVLENDLKLKIDDFGKESAHSGRIRDYHELLSGYMRRLQISGAIHIANRFKPHV